MAKAKKKTKPVRYQVQIKNTRESAWNPKPSYIPLNTRSSYKNKADAQKALKKAKALRSDQTFWKLRVKKIGGRK